MADPWADFRLKPEEAKGDEWTEFRAQKPYSGSILPFSKGEDGKVRFDSNAGLLGSLKSAFTLPGDVYAGRVDPKSDEGIGRSLDMASWFGPSSVAARSGERAIPGKSPNLRPVLETPSVDQLKAAGGAGYKAARDAGVDFDSRAVKSFADTAAAELEAIGFRRNQADKTFDVIFGKGGLANPPANSVAPLAGLESARQSLSRLTVDGGATGTEREAARELLKRLDTFLDNPPQGSVVAGPAAEATRTLKDARGNWAAAKRSELLARKEDITDLRAAAANSGQNFDQALRGRIASVPFNNREIAGFNAAEEDALRQFVQGSTPRNAAREIANVLGGGGGMGMAIPAGMGGALGGAVAGPPGAAVGAVVPPAIGRIAKILQNRMSEAEFAKIQELVRSRSPLAEAMRANPRMTPADPKLESALIRALMGLDPMPAEREQVR